MKSAVGKIELEADKNRLPVCINDNLLTDHPVLIGDVDEARRTLDFPSVYQEVLVRLS